MSSSKVRVVFKSELFFAPNSHGQSAKFVWTQKSSREKSWEKWAKSVNAKYGFTEQGCHISRFVKRLLDCNVTDEVKGYIFNYANPFVKLDWMMLISSRIEIYCFIYFAELQKGTTRFQLLPLCHAAYLFEKYSTRTNFRHGSLCRMAHYFSHTRQNI